MAVSAADARHALLEVLDAIVGPARKCAVIAGGYWRGAVLKIIAVAVDIAAIGACDDDAPLRVLACSAPLACGSPRCANVLAGGAPWARIHIPSGGRGCAGAALHALVVSPKIAGVAYERAVIACGGRGCVLVISSAGPRA